jgi:hypothetical protein
MFSYAVYEYITLWASCWISLTSSTAKQPPAEYGGSSYDLTRPRLRAPTWRRHLNIKEAGPAGGGHALHLDLLTLTH